MMVVYPLNEIGTSQWQCTSFHTDMLVIMKESTVLAKSLVHISFLEKLCFFFIIMSPCLFLCPIQISF